ncbi:hypothetical protein AB0M23_28525 [Streptomyces sp. NPDC052077]|uniref:hypothetical protein n=1 Tax=Streptomyces sp. NPDC052077 TaxID=3154757 RepID=UPI003432EE35
MTTTPPAQPCTDLRHTGRIRAQLGCTGPDPVAGPALPESARALLARHGLPEDIADGALRLHAQELAAVQRTRAAADGLLYTGTAQQLIDPARGAAAVPALSVEGPALRDRIAAALERADYRPDMRRGDLADAIMPVLPALVDQATVRAGALRDAADGYALLADQGEAYDREQDQFDETARLQHQTVRDVAAGLRRMADETAAAGAQQHGAQHPGGPRPHTERRDAFARMIYERWNPGLSWDDAHPDDLICYGADADAAMAAADAVSAGRSFAAPTDADIYREVADRLDELGTIPSKTWAPPAADQVREWADQGPAQAGAPDVETTAEHPDGPAPEAQQPTDAEQTCRTVPAVLDGIAPAPTQEPQP